MKKIMKLLVRQLIWCFEYSKEYLNLRSRQDNNLVMGVIIAIDLIFVVYLVAFLGQWICNHI
jgi:hypothetical protein